MMIQLTRLGSMVHVMLVAGDDERVIKSSVVHETKVPLAAMLEWIDWKMSVAPSAYSSLPRTSMV